MAKVKNVGLATWDAELAKQAEIAAGMEASAGGGNFFSLRGGILQWQDAPLKDNQMGVIIIDHVLENVFYADKYDPETPQSPSCFAFARDERTMAPHKLVVEAGTAVHETCVGCPNNEWGSADTGRGKACRNTRRLALISAGTFDAAGRFVVNDDPEHWKSAVIGYMKLPVMSVKGFATFVKQVAVALKRPPHGVITKVRVVPDPKSQFRVLFEAISPVPNTLMAAIMARHEESSATIDFPYQRADDDAPTGAAKTDRRPPADARRSPKRARKY